MRVIFPIRGQCSTLNIPLVQRQDAVLGVEKHVLLFRHGFSPHNISAFKYKKQNQENNVLGIETNTVP